MNDDRLPKVLIPMVRREFPVLVQGKIWGVEEFAEWSKNHTYVLTTKGLVLSCISDKLSA